MTLIGGKGNNATTKKVSLNKDEEKDSNDISTETNITQQQQHTTKQLPKETTHYDESNENNHNDWEIHIQATRSREEGQRNNHQEKKRKRGPTRSKTTQAKRKIQTKIRIVPKYSDKEGNHEQRKTQYQMKIDDITNTIQARQSKWKERADILDHWGDQLTTQNEWPNVNSRETLRLLHINMNGINYNNDYIEWEIILGNLAQLQVDIFGITEPNLDLNNKRIQETLREKVKHFDKHMKLSVSSSLQKIGETPYKRGGTITGVNGCWSGRMVPAPQQERYGRWSEAILGGRNGKKLYILTIYRTCPYSKTYGGNTIYMQQQRDLLQKKMQHKDPRKDILVDLGIRIRQVQEEGHKIIIMGDFNENVQDSSMTSFLEDNGLKNALIARHGHDTVLPATYDKGRHSVDMIAISQDLNSEAIKKAGCLPFYSHFLTDHRGIYVDIDITTLFNKVYEDTTRSTYKRFTTASVQKCNIYLKELEDSMEKSRVFQKVEKMKRTMYNIINKRQDGKDLKRVIQECKALNKRVTELMIHSEKKCGRAVYTEGLPYSRELWTANKIAFEKKKQLKLIEAGYYEATEEEKETAEKEFRYAKERFIQAQRIAPELRKKWIQDLSKKRAVQWNMERVNAIRIIEETELVRNSNKRQARWLKPRRHGQLRSLLVPAPKINAKNNIYDISSYIEIENPDDIFNVLLRRNYHHLLRSQHSIFSKGKVLDQCGWYAEREGIEGLLSGTMDTEDLSTDYPEFPKEAKTFLDSLKKSNDTDGNTIGEYIWQYGTTEYLETFKKTNESTACGPSGLHMSHWKAACERERIAEVHAFFIWAAMQFGFSYERWEKSWHCMLQKTEWAIYPKLRIIQLFEGDFNAALKYLIGKTLMKYTTELNLLNDDIFGSRKGKTSTEAMITLQLSYDHHRTWQKVMVSLFNDAEGCYDRIPANLADICMQRIGCPKSVANCHTEVQKNMKHFIRIAAGISKGYIEFKKTYNTQIQRDTAGNILSISGKTGGIGQGGGGGPMAWIAVIQVMLLAYSKLCKGVTMEDCLRWTVVCIYIVSYVDDNTLLRQFPANTTTKEIINGIKENFTTWNKLLQITGGDLCLDKCEYSVMKWQYNNKGIPYMVPSTQIQEEVTVTSVLDTQQEEQIIKRLEPGNATRVLGIRLPMTGNMKQEYDYRLQQVKQLATKIRNAPLSTMDIYLAYSSRYRPMIKYPLGVTLFSDKQCHTIQKKFIFELLPKLSLNRHTNRTLVYGPRIYGGLEIMDLRLEQPVASWTATLGHIRRMDNTGKALMITYSDHQVYIGSGHYFHNLDPDKYSYGPSYTRWDYTWRMAYENNLAIVQYTRWKPTLRDENDVNIMDAAVEYYQPITNETRERLWHINQCRIYLRAFNISDITHNGTTIKYSILTGEERRENHYQITFPNIRRPVRYQWEIFEEFIQRRFLTQGGKLKHYINIEAVTTLIQHKTPMQRMTEKEIIEQMYDSVSDIHDKTRWELPPSLSGLVETTSMPHEQVQKLIDKIKYGNVVGACDGSLLTLNRIQGQDYTPNTVGSYGFILQDEDNNTNYLQGSHVSPTSNTMSTLTTESFGCLAILTMLHLLSAQGQLHKYEGIMNPVTIALDNQEVLDRTYNDPTETNISDFMCPEWDLWKMMRLLKRLLPIRVNFVKIKSHQDVNEMGQTIHGPYDLMTTMNMEADKLATLARHYALELSIPRPLYSFTGIILVEKSTSLQITDLREYLLMTRHGKELIEYLTRKYNWEEHIPTMIDWKGLDQYLKKSGILRRLKVLQLQNDWQNVGIQKKKFNEARDNTQNSTLPPVTNLRRDEEKCPAQCGENEGHLHYMTCTAEIMRKERQHLFSQCRRELTKMDTHPGIIDAAIWCMLKYCDGAMADEYSLKLKAWEEDNLIPIILNNQENIGYDLFLKGIITKEWTFAQREYWKTNPKRRFGAEGWTSKFIHSIMMVTIGMWKFRNELIHGKTLLETKELKKKRLKERIEELYKEKKKLSLPLDLKVFEMPLGFRKKQGIQQMELWIGLAEDTLKNYEIEKKNNPLLRWLTQSANIDGEND